MLRSVQVMFIERCDKDKLFLWSLPLFTASFCQKWSSQSFPQIAPHPECHVIIFVLLPTSGIHFLLLHLFLGQPTGESFFPHFPSPTCLS